MWAADALSLGLTGFLGFSLVYWLRFTVFGFEALGPSAVGGLALQRALAYNSGL